MFSGVSEQSGHYPVPFFHVDRGGGQTIRGQLIESHM
jgi:hypothetical protein